MGVAIVGYGYWGPNLARNFHNLPHVDLKYICDLEAPRRDVAAHNHPLAQVVADVDEALADPAVSAVAIATPISTHHGLAKRALEAGKHVLVEKPLAASAREAEDLAVLADESGLVLQVDHTFLFCDPVMTIRDIVSSGGVGEVLYVDSVRVNLGLFQSDHSVVWDLAPHDVSIMMHVLDRRVEAVSATGVSHYSAFGHSYNMAQLSLFFGEGILGHVHVNWLAPAKIRRMIVGGSEKMIVWDDLESLEKLRIYDKGVTMDLSKEETYEALVRYRLGDVVAPALPGTEPLARECAAFVDAFRNGTPVLSGGWFGVDVVRVLEAAERSIQERGVPVKVEY